LISIATPGEKVRMFFDVFDNRNVAGASSTEMLKGWAAGTMPTRAISLGALFEDSCQAGFSKNTAVADI
jgi:hypothetical protein